MPVIIHDKRRDDHGGEKSVFKCIKLSLEKWCEVDADPIEG